MGRRSPVQDSYDEHIGVFMADVDVGVRFQHRGAMVLHVVSYIVAFYTQVMWGITFNPRN